MQCTFLCNVMSLFKCPFLYFTINAVQFIFSFFCLFLDCDARRKYLRFAAFIQMSLDGTVSDHMSNKFDGEKYCWKVQGWSF